LKTGAIADAVGAICEGPADREITGVGSLESADPGQLSFCTGGRWLEALARTRAGAVLVAPGAPVPEGVVALRHPNPRWAFAKVARRLNPVEWPSPGVHARAEVHPTAVVEGATVEAFAVIEAGAVLAPGSWIQAHAYVGRNVTIGARSRLMPQAVVMDGCTLGEGVVLKPGAVVGADGFGYAVGPDGLVKVPQLGVAVLEDDVEVGANACVDRAALGETRVGRGTRLDNLVQVAHNVQIGARSLLAAFSGVAGGARLGDEVVMGGRAAVVDGVSVGDRSVLAALTSASRDAPAGSRLGGSPARPYAEWLRETAALRALPELIRAIHRIEKKIRKE
jgi:UDP-3-O-[3-hydroxymyristoyl] glucosamine N-acyltransferase